MPLITARRKIDDTPVIEFRKLTIIRGETKALDRVTLVIKRGENALVLGPNGSGKSSLIKAITRECYPLAQEKDGCFRIFGSARWDIARLRGRLGVVSDGLQRSLDVDIPAREAVLSGFFSSVGVFRRDITPAMARRATAVMRFLGIWQLRDRRMTEMSLGEARKVLIGRALCHDPAVLVLDEPTAGLDFAAAARFRGLLSKIARSGRNIILVTHTVDDIIPEINRVILLKSGRIIGDGAPRKVLTQASLRRLFGAGIRVSAAGGAWRIY